LSGDLNNDSQTTSGVDSRSVVLGNGVSSATLSGVTIERGFNTGAAAGGFVGAGGLTLIDSTKIDFFDVIVRNCSALDDGFGARIVDSSAVRFVDCDFLDNGGPIDIDVAGAGVFLSGSGSTSFTDCSFVGNGLDTTSGLSRGGAATVSNALTRFTRCTFFDNDAARGGAVFVQTEAEFETCTFELNLAGNQGGAVTTSNVGTASFNFCSFNKNRSFGDGGAINDDLEASGVLVQNSMFIDNRARQGAAIYGGAITVYDSVFTGNESINPLGQSGTIHIDRDANSVLAELVNLTVADNIGAASHGAVFAESGANVFLRNSILWGNRDGMDSDRQSQSRTAGSASISLRFSLVQDGVFGGYGSGAGNISADPRFTNPGQGDYRLAIGSPAIDAGDSTFNVLSGQVDVDNLPRVVDALDYIDRGIADDRGPIDMGAHEAPTDLANDAPCPPADLSGDGLVDYFDFVAYFDAVSISNRDTADLDRDGQINAEDVGLFEALAELGCN
ncbi:MAG: hypothetical protein AAF747_11975, partial [Planctomycetota bacterium]